MDDQRGLAEFGSELSRTMGMRLGGHANIDRVGRDDFDGLASDIGMTTRTLNSLSASLVEKIDAAFDRAAAPLLDSGPDGIETLVALVRGGYKRRRTHVPASA